MARGSFIGVRGLLCSCGAQAPEHVGSVVCGTRALSLRRASSVVVAHGLGCPAACGILVPRPRIKHASLHWKADSLPLDHQGSPRLNICPYFVRNIQSLLLKTRTDCAPSALSTTKYLLFTRQWSYSTSCVLSL